MKHDAKRLGLKTGLIVALMVLVPWTASGKTAALKVAAVQTPNLDGQYEQSKEVAERLIERAADQGARLILLPEFGLIGYVFDDSIWEMAEPLEGPTVQWLRGLCRKHKVYIATCILELRGDDFYDTLVLVGPGEGELWAHRKIEPALYEARYFRGGGINPSVFDTPLGRIGVAICFDTSKTHTARDLLDGGPDLLLMTFSAPQTPVVPQSMKQKTIDSNNQAPVIFARVLDVPVVSVNKTGKWNSPLPGVPGARLKSDFSARSRIVDADGNVLASLDKEEAVIVAEVEIGGDRRPDPGAIPDGRWILPYDGLMRWFSDSVYKMGKVRYKHSPARKRAVEQAKARYGLE